MSYITRNLRQTATYWAPGGNDGFGGTIFGVPTPLKVRWEDKTTLFVNTSGKEERARARIYIKDTDISLGGYIFLGTSTSTAPESVTGAFEVKDFRKTPNMRATEFERRVLI